MTSRAADVFITIAIVMGIVTLVLGWVGIVYAGDTIRLESCVEAGMEWFKGVCVNEVSTDLLLKGTR